MPSRETRTSSLGSTDDYGSWVDTIDKDEVRLNLNGRAHGLHSSVAQPEV